MHRRDFLNRVGAFAAFAPKGTRAHSSTAPSLEDFAARKRNGAFLIRDLYNPDQSFSPLARACEGARVTFTGFMAPPLKADARFFVLTKMPMAVCPFCEPDADWPADILPAHTKRKVKIIPFNLRISATGIFRIGRHIDENTGFYSLIRLTDATYGS